MVGLENRALVGRIERQRKPPLSDIASAERRRVSHNFTPGNSVTETAPITRYETRGRQGWRLSRTANFGEMLYPSRGKPAVTSGQHIFASPRIAPVCETMSQTSCAQPHP